MKGANNRKYAKRPRINDEVASLFGDGRVVRVENYGKRLTLATKVHGEVVIDRAVNGWWVVTKEAK